MLCVCCHQNSRHVNNAVQATFDFGTWHAALCCSKWPLLLQLTTHVSAPSRICSSTKQHTRQTETRAVQLSESPDSSDSGMLDQHTQHEACLYSTAV